MALNNYHFITVWRVKAVPEEVSDVLDKATDLPRWWPSVYLDVKELKPGGERGIGKLVELYTKGWLPYTLRWQFRVTENNYPYGYTIQAFGDFTGRGIWTIEPDGEWSSVTYDWLITANKLLLKALSFLLKPIFAANHRWAMKMGEKSLALELERRRAATPEEAASVPAPPRPTFTKRNA